MKSSICFVLVLLTFGLASACLGMAHDDAGAKDLVTAYAPLRDALANDDLDAAKQAARQLADDKNESIAGHAKHLIQSDTLDDARTQFKAISEEVIKHAGKKPGNFVMTCSMAKADWLQTNKDVQNPYMGKKMLKCGEIKSVSGKSKSHCGSCE
ncbi:MAG: DUF3347 domain-containing protein [Verrucomicrobia bacterium]|nr:DUF3347 domain-containing protein [Verrucomicrobiota bacterium]